MRIAPAPVPDLAAESFRLLVESVEDYAIFMLDVDGRVLTWNRGAARIKGYSADEIVGRHFTVFHPADDVAAGVTENHLRTAVDEGRVETEGWRLRKDGSRFWANVVITALRDDAGRLAGFAKVTRDLTARKQAEDTARELVREQAARAAAEQAEGRLRDERERYRALSKRLEVILEGVGDGITAQDRHGTFTFANSAAARACGYDSVEAFLRASRAEISARFELFDEHGKPFDRGSLPSHRVLNGEETATVLLRVRERASGRESWLLVRASPVRGDRGGPELAVNVWRDVTADRRREEHERYVARAAATLASSLDCEAMLRSLAGVLVPGLADRCSIHLLEGDDLRNVAVVGTGKPELDEEIRDELLRRGARNAEHFEMVRDAGTRSVIIVPIRSGDRVSGTISLVSSESGRRYDATDVALAEELGRRAGGALESARLFAQAQAAVRAAEEASRVKDEFLATVSHELRTPLNAIVGWTSLLRERTTDPGIARGLDVIARNAQAQAKIIEDILDVSRIITGKLRLDLEPVDLVSIVRDAVEVVRPSASAKRIALDFTLPRESTLLLADPGRLQQVVWNLLSNAVKFTDAGGAIRIAVERKGGDLVATVTDTGRGIDQEFLPYVFDRFKQADSSTTRRFGGLGLGLAIVRHIVELHGGRVAATSPGPGQGAAFSITLPLRSALPFARETETSMPAAEENARRSSVSLDGFRVLVVDDEADARDLLRMMLEEAGAHVQTAASGSEAFELLQRFRPDVLVSDIGMPDEDGYGLMRRIRALDPARGGAVPAIALTAYARGEDRTRALGVGFTTHIGKPVGAEDLVAAVASLAR